MDKGCYFDPRAADRVESFFAKFLRHSKGEYAGRPFELLAWQARDYFRPLYGWKRANGTRRFRRAGCAVPKKNGKSTMLAGQATYGLLGDGEAGPEVYSAAADRDQASIIFNEAANMVEASPALRSRLEVIQSGRRIKSPLNGGVYKALSADVPTKEGLNIHYLLFDELHAQRAWDLFNALKYGGAARRQPIFAWITTAGYDSTSLCWHQWQYARGVLSGAILDPWFLPVIYEASESDDWTLESTWQKANPSYGVTLNAEDFAADFLEAQSSATAESAFKRYRLNLWVRALVAWIKEARWRACGRAYSWEQFGAWAKRSGVWAGWDMSSVSDVTACVLLTRVPDGPYAVWPLFWLPRDTARQRQREQRVSFYEWERLGHVRFTDGDAVDYDTARMEFAEVVDGLTVREVGVDPWNATQFSSDLLQDGFRVQWVRQGFQTLSPPSKELEKLVLSQGIIHPNNPVLDWMLGNAVVEQDASGNIKPSKRRSTEKIDGVSALVSALALVVGKGQKGSKYEKGAKIQSV